MTRTDLLHLLYCAAATCFTLPVIRTAWRIDAMSVVVVLLVMAAFHVLLAVARIRQILRRRAERRERPPFTSVRSLPDTH